jgi:hypothetical protein
LQGSTCCCEALELARAAGPAQDGDRARQSHEAATRPARWSSDADLSFELDCSAGGWDALQRDTLAPGQVVAINGSAVKASDGSLSAESHFPSLTLMGCWATSGSWYFEVEVLRPGLAQIGWATAYF